MKKKLFFKKFKKKSILFKGQKGTLKRPRLSVYRSNRFIYAQIIDDIHGKTLLSVSEKEIQANKMKKTEKAIKIGEILAKKLMQKNIKQVIFDRRNYKYHGRVKSLAEGVRSGGIKI